MMEKVGLQAPWTTYFNKIKAIFGDDPEITMYMDDEEETKTIVMECSNSIKASALTKLLNKNVSLGNIKIDITIADTSENDVSGDLIEAAFKGNPHFSQVIIPHGGGFVGDKTFCLMRKEVIQFFNDDLTDPFGNYNGLAEDILREITVPSPHVSYATDTVG